MSFVRVGRPRQLPKSKRPVCTKKAVAPKREWVSTVTDLSVHKLTPAELSRRHEIHKSHNKAAAQWELREKALRCRLRCAGSPAPLDQASLNIIREVFSDQLLLQDVLARSDKAMAVVKDLFGDAPRRQTGHPSVTMAPNCDSDSELPVLQRPDPPTQLSLLSQSMMDKQALNELEASEEDLSDEYIHPHGNSGYHVIRRDNIRRRKVKSRGGMKAHHANSDEADRDNVHVTPCTSGRAPDRTALNATVAVQRIQSKQNQSEEAKEEHSALVSQVLNPDVSLNQSGRIHSCTNRTRNCVSQGSQLDGSSVASLSGNQSSLGQLQALLGQVEADLDTLSPDTAPGSAQSPEQHRTQGLTGFSVALVSTLRRLVHVLKQREEEAQKRAQEKRQLEEELREHRGLIDALTTETMILREEAATLQAVLQQQIAELEQKLDTVVLGFGLLEGHTDTPQDSDVEAAVCQSAPVPEQTRATVSPAVLLSPPQQRDNWQHILVADPVPLHQKHSPVDNCRSYKNFKCHSSTSSLTSLTLTRLPSTSSLSLSSDPLSSQNPPEAILAEIAQLSRQNDSIRAQLSQVKVLGSGAEGSPNGGSEQRSLSSCSTGRITPQSDGERKTAGFSSTGRTSENIQVTERDKLTCQVTSPNTLNVSILEQHLLELNRQNAAARVKLLELIEQQKQSVMSKVPPSASPISQSASAAHAAVGGGSPEVSMLLPSQTDAGERRCADFQVPSSSFGEICDGKTQMEKQREQEGWFALSAHMRSKKSNN